MDFKDKLNNILLSNIGVVIMTGTEELLAFPERKEVMENDWAEENGGDYDLSSPKFKDKEVTLKMAILADDNVQFWQYHNTLFAELKKEGELSLYVFDHDQTYKVFYKKSGNFKKTLKRLKNAKKVFVKFDLT
ncbi:S9 family peptidase, partial [Riemerella anatipestifer]